MMWPRSACQKNGEPMTCFNMEPCKRHEASIFEKALGSKVQYEKTTFYEIIGSYMHVLKLGSYFKVSRMSKKHLVYLASGMLFLVHF